MTQSCSFILAVITVSYIAFYVEARTRCVIAVGRVQCNADSVKNEDVEIKLMDWDGGHIIDPDDTMGVSETDAEGVFQVEGCGYDIGPWNRPDPYLRIWHYCTNPAGSEIRTSVQQIFRPDLNDFGVINLD